MKKTFTLPNRVIFNVFKNSWFDIFSAFSLVEMLMALLVASLLMAALAPVMTRKISDNVKIAGLGETYKAPADMRCYPYSDSQPEVDVSINDVYSVSFLISSAGGGGAGATSSRKVAATPVQITGTSSSDTTREIAITEYMTDVKATLAAAGGGGGGGAGYVSACPAGTQQFAGDSTVQSFCMTKYNVGERENQVQNLNYDYVPARSGGAMYYADDETSKANCSAGKTMEAKCCYRTRSATAKESFTADPVYCNQDPGPSHYNTCTRTLCQYDVANSSCNAFSYVPSDIPKANWGLPRVAQLDYLETIEDPWIIGANGAFLCTDGPSVTGIWACSVTGFKSDNLYRCHGGADMRCYPNMIYSYADTSPYKWYSLKGHDFTGASNSSKLHAFSARCTLEKSNLFKSYSGAAGGSGAYISELDITEYVKKTGVGGKITLIAGKEGKGGDAASTNNTKANDGTAGNYSEVIIKKQTGEIVYGIRVKGGNGGIAAKDITATGGAATNAEISTSKNCEETTNGTNWSETSCTKNILKGANGEIKWKESATKGAASISPVTSTISGNGAGGEGGSSSYGYNDKITSTAGANGKAGLVKISYNNEYAAAPGGGGGGGTVAQIKDVQLGRQAECKLIIGKGGKGGNVDNNGTDGGFSSIKCTTDTRTFIIPGGKGGEKGIPAASADAIPTAGTGGEYGDITKATTDTIKNYNSSKKVINEGTSGEEGKYDQAAKQSIGGRGGASGTGTKGACGGLYIEEDENKGVCLVSDTDPKRAEGKGFTYEETITPNANTLSNSLGISGAGGGGGGWIRELGPAKGGDGMNGYVCVYWYNTD